MLTCGNKQGRGKLVHMDQCGSLIRGRFVQTLGLVKSLSGIQSSPVTWRKNAGQRTCHFTTSKIVSQDTSEQESKELNCNEPKEVNSDPDSTKHQVNKMTMIEQRKLPPEPPTTCCMSSCPNCVWIDYADELVKYYKDGGSKAKEAIQKHVEDPGLKAYLLLEISRSVSDFMPPDAAMYI